MADEKSEGSTQSSKNPIPQSDTGQESKSLRPTSPEGSVHNPELEVLLTRIKEMKEDLDQRLTTLFELGREKHIDVQSLFGNIYQLTLQQVEALAQHERRLAEKLKKAIPPESCIKRVEKSKEKLTQERKGKFRGTRQKWLPM